MRLPAVVLSLSLLRKRRVIARVPALAAWPAPRPAHHEDFIIGEEVTAFFPSEALHVHVLVCGIDEQKHTEIGALRFNVFELVEYLRGRGIADALAHPFSLVVGELRRTGVGVLLG